MYQSNSIEKVLEIVDTFVHDQISISQEKLDIQKKSRTSLFPWRGQFSPELVELILEEYGNNNSVILDPFVGSGTTLFESARVGLNCYGSEINPSAIEMARTSHFVNIDKTDRKRIIKIAESLANKHFATLNLDLFLYQFYNQNNQSQLNVPIEKIISKILQEVTEEELVFNLFTNAVIRYLNYKQPRTAKTFLHSLREHCKIVEELPYSKNQCRVFHSDARTIPLPDKCIDLVVTSPPYINVFNYHQNNRPAMELLGWDLLKVAKSEIGSNRKNRQNRFLTVVQYALDMQDVFKEIHRLLKPHGRAIIIIGRESSVRGVSFKNSKLVAAIAVGIAEFTITNIQERKFKNRFGELIYEDIIHFTPTSVNIGYSNITASSIATHILTDVVNNTEDKQVKCEIKNAKERSKSVCKSPLFELPIQHQLLEDKFICKLKYKQLCKELLMTTYPTPHLEKLNALLRNPKLPVSENPRVTQALKVYRHWIASLDKTVLSNAPIDQILKKLVGLFNGYKLFIDIFLIFDSPNDFLYRQKGQLKLDNTIIEEFLPRLINPVLIPEIQETEVVVGSTKAFSSIFFESSLDTPAIGGGLRIRAKDQDFAISKKIYIKASHSANFDVGSVLNTSTNLAYVAAECKTNLDKTMFQEGCATARDVKSAVAGAKYFLLCEWLDMTPLSTAPTDIDEIIILRKAKRISSNMRNQFDTFAGRQAKRAFYYQYLKDNPFRVEMFERFINHIRKLLNHEELIENDILSLGYF